jgi:hypothetical protein
MKWTILVVAAVSVVLAVTDPLAGSGFRPEAFQAAVRTLSQSTFMSCDGSQRAQGGVRCDTTFVG